MKLFTEILKSIEMLKESQKKEIELINKSIQSKKNKIYEYIKTNAIQAENSVNKYNNSILNLSDSLHYCLINIDRKSTINVNEEFEAIFEECLSRIEEGAIKSHNITSSMDYFDIKRLIENPLNTALYIYDDFEKLYKLKYEENDKKFFKDESKKIKEKYNIKIEELNNKIKKILAENIDYSKKIMLNNKISESAFCFDQDDDDYGKIPFAFIEDKDLKNYKDFMFLDLFNNKSNILYHFDGNNYHFFSFFIFEILDKIFETDLELYLLGNFSIDIIGIFQRVRGNLKTQNVITFESDVQNIKSRLERANNEMKSRASKYLFDKDFKTYNEKNPSNKDKAIFLAIDKVNYFDNEIVKQINLLLKDGQTYGIYLILLSDDVEIKSRYGEEKELLSLSDISYEVFVEKEFIAKCNNQIINLDLINQSFDLKSFISSIKDRKISINKPILFNEIMSDDYDSSDFSRRIIIPIGKSGSEIVKAEFDINGSGTSFMIVAGMTGSGKSEFLHTMILSSAYIYSPEQLNFYLIDFKDGLEFESYMNVLSLPHVKLISRRNTLDDAYVILKKIINILETRGKIISQAGCKDINDYNMNNPNTIIPRLFIYIDEYQVMIEGNASNSDNRLLTKCNSALVDIVKRGRTAGISLILSSQQCVAGKDIKEQVANRVVFKSQGVLDKLFNNLDYNAEDILKTAPKGTAYYTDGSKTFMFRSAYMTKENESKNGSKNYIANLIREKYPKSKYPINIIVSNDEKELLYEESSYNEKDFIDIGVSVFDNEHVNLNISSSKFSNYLLFGDVDKAFEVEASILNSIYFKNQKNNLYIYSLNNHNSDAKLLNYILYDVNFSSKVSDLYDKLYELYDIMCDRIKDSQQGKDITNYSNYFILINNFDYELISSYSDMEVNEKSCSKINDDIDDDIFANRIASYDSFSIKTSKKLQLTELLSKLYCQGSKYNIYIFTHVVCPKDFESLFTYGDKPHYDKAIYLNKDTYNYYLEKLSFQNRKIDLETQNSILVCDDDIIKFKRYKFKE